MLVFEIIFSILAFALGSSFASFAGVIAYRYPKGLSIVKPNSYCPHCKKTIGVLDNIPIISWLILGGKCRYCKSNIGVFSLLIEIFGGLGFMFSYWEYGNDIKSLPIFIALMLLIFLFLIIAEIDYETRDIYNVTLILYAAIAIFIFLYRVLIYNSNVWNYIVGAALGFVFFGTIKILSKLTLKKDALGSGDVFIVGIGGLIVGAMPLLIAIIIATLLGSVIEITKIKASKIDKNTEIAFAPYLLLGIGLMAIYGEKLMTFYWEVMLNAFI